MSAIFIRKCAKITTCSLFIQKQILGQYEDNFNAYMVVEVNAKLYSCQSSMYDKMICIFYLITILS